MTNFEKFTGIYCLKAMWKIPWAKRTITGRDCSGRVGSQLFCTYMETLAREQESIAKSCTWFSKRWISTLSASTTEDTQILVKSLLQKRALWLMPKLCSIMSRKSLEIPNEFLSGVILLALGKQLLLSRPIKNLSFNYLLRHCCYDSVSSHMVADLCVESNKPAGLILESPFTSIGEEVKHHMLSAVC